MRSPPASSSPAEPPELAATLAFLQRPESWAAASVEVVRTHLAYVFLVDDRAYKLKRPVRWHDVDYTRLDARRIACEREVELNRRFSRDVYLGVEPLRSRAGELGFGPDGEVVDWLVRMRRLPGERMLDRRIATGRIDEPTARRLGVWLARRHGQLAPAERDPAAHLARLRRVIADDFAVLRTETDGVAAPALDRIHSAQDAFLTRHADIVAARVRGEKIVEGHGDLRPEHICLDDEPAVIDCLEWDGDLRVIDGFVDLVFLALECKRMGAREIGDAILAGYRQGTGDRPDPRLVAFYRAQQATARAKLAVWHLAEPGASGPLKWERRAREYLRLAEQACSDMR